MHDFRIEFLNDIIVPGAVIETNSNCKFKNPIVDFINNTTYNVTYTSSDAKPRIYISKMIAYDPLTLYLQGSLKIHYVANMKQVVAKKDDAIVNFKCNLIDADNCFKLYRSPLPDFYIIQKVSSDFIWHETEAKEFYFAEWNYPAKSENFKSLIEGKFLNYMIMHLEHITDLLNQIMLGLVLIIACIFQIKCIKKTHMVHQKKFHIFQLKRMKLIDSH